MRSTIIPLYSSFMLVPLYTSRQKLTISAQPAPVENIEAPETYIGFLVAFMNAQSTGEITLRSADPKDPPLIDPKFLSHALDKRVAIESMREVLEFTDAPYLAEHQDQLVGPKGRSDEEILVCLGFCVFARHPAFLFVPSINRSTISVHLCY